VHQQRHDATALGVAPDALPGADLALDDRVDDLKVGRIGGEADLDLLSRGGVEHRFVSEMILHIAVTGDRFGDVIF